MKRFIWFILTMALLPVSAFASRDSTSTDTTVVAPFSQGSKTRKVLFVRAGGWISAIGRIETDTLKSRSGATIILQGNFVDAAGTQQNYTHVQADSFSTDSLTVTGNGVITGNLSIQGGTTIGNASGDALTYHPSAWTLTNAVTITGTWTNLGTVTTADINGGTVDGVIVGGASAAAGTFTTLKADSTWFGSGDFTLAPTQNIATFGGGTFESNGAGSYVVGINGGAAGATIQLVNSTTGTTNGDGTLFVQSGLNFLFINREAGLLYFRTSDTNAMQISSGGTISVLRDSLLIGETASSTNDIYISDRLADWDDSNYFIDPNSSSVLATVKPDSVWAGSGDVILAPTQNIATFNVAAKVISTADTMLTVRSSGSQTKAVMIVDGNSSSGTGRAGITISAKSNVGAAIEFKQGGAQIWLTGAGGASDSTAYEFYNPTFSGNVLHLRPTGNVVVGWQALATTATDGFLYIPSCAGTPTGVPTVYTGRTALIYDSTNNLLYANDGGGWVATNSP